MTNINSRLEVALTNRQDARRTIREIASTIQDVRALQATSIPETLSAHLANTVAGLYLDLAFECERYADVGDEMELAA